MTVRGLLTWAAITVAAAYLCLFVVFPDAVFAFTFDDGFYYLGIARNLADGQGSTWDGIEPTNGYHPLWTAMLVPIYLLGTDGMTALRVAMVVQLALYGAALVVLARCVGVLVDGWPRLGDVTRSARRACDAAVVVAFVLAVANPFVVRTFVNGLESGLVVLVGALALSFAIGTGGRWLDTEVTPARRWVMAALLGLSFLARTDAVVMIGALGLWCLADAVRLGRSAIRPLLVLFALPMLVVGAFLIGNWIEFGSALQVSGVVKRAELTRTALLGVLCTIAAAGGVGLVTHQRREAGDPPSRFGRLRRVMGATGWYGAGCVLLVGYYQFLQVQLWLWYYAPVVLYLILLLVVGVADFVESALVEAPASRRVSRTLAPVLALLLTPLVIGMVIQIEAIRDPNLRSIQLANRDAGLWIDANLADDAVLASWDAGVIGYFAERSTVNLDGVVNSFAYDDARRDGLVGPFLRQRGVGYVANHGEMVDGDDPAIVGFIASAFGDGVAADSTVLETWPFEFSGVLVGEGFQGRTGDKQQAVFVYRLPSPPAPAAVSP